MRLVGTVIPHGHRPEYYCGKHGRHGIDFTLDSGEPERVGEAVCQRADKPGADDRDSLCGRILTLVIRADDTADEPDNGEIKEENGESRAYRTHRIHKNGSMPLVTEKCEKSRNQLKHRVSGRMSHFQLVR